MKEAGLPAPTLHEHTGCLLMTFKLPEQRGGVSEGVSEGVSALLGLIRKQPGMRSPAMAVALGTSGKNIERWLKQLKSTQKIEYRGAPKTGGYYCKKT